MSPIPAGRFPHPVFSQIHFPSWLYRDQTSEVASLKDCIANYRKETDEHKRKKTFAAYRLILEYVANFCIASQIAKATAHLTKEVKAALTKGEKASLDKEAKAAYELIRIQDLTREGLLDYALQPA